MKKICLISLVLALFAVPLCLSAQVEPVAGSMSIGAHVDFVARYSAEDNDDPDADEVYWEGYETFNTESAIVVLSGKVGDNISWMVAEQLAGNSWSGEIATPNGTATLRDAWIKWDIMDSVALKMGRYTPSTSMSQTPWRLRTHRFIDPPIFIKQSAYLFTMLPLPALETGIGITGSMGPVTLTWQLFNGTEVVYTTSLNDVDKSKGGVLKAAYDSGGLHAGLWYLNEYSEYGSLTIGGLPYVYVEADEDANVGQWGLEVSYKTDRFMVAAEYVDYVLDLLDEDVPDLKQQAYYLMGGVGVGPVEILLRYDFAEGGYDEFFDDFDGMDVGEDEVPDRQADWTLGVNYSLNDNTEMALNYTFRDPETWEYDDDDDYDLGTIDELAFMVELHLL